MKFSFMLCTDIHLIVNTIPITANFSSKPTANRNSNRNSGGSRSNNGTSFAFPSRNSQGGNSGSNSTNKNNFNNRSGVTCQLCDKPGHHVKQCRKLLALLNTATGSNSSGSFNNSNRTSSQPRANFTSQAAYSDASWLVGSGASYHVIEDLQNLSLHSDYDESNEVMLGDGCSSGSGPFSDDEENNLDLSSVHQALKYPRWREAMNEELYALQSQGTWTLFPPVPHTMPVGSKWGFQVKYNSDGSVGRYKVRLVAKGFLQRPGFGLIIYLIMYVDDIIITGNNSHHVEDFVTRLGRRFSIKDLGGLNFFLGVEVVRTPTGLFLTQQKYIYEIVEQTNMNDAKPMRTPTASGSCPRLDNGSPLNDPKEYQNIVGSLQYLLLTRPDVAFIVNKLSQFTSSPTTAHWALVKRVLRYLAGTSDLGIYLRKSSPINLHAFSNSD
ncbi:putative mitochondrial protein [Nicotiana attenuata]|uniref:Mitochondrial protein n=1 Tax=Nicotiana attenuata TaxID=49451 RepID=A0A314LAP5_NICAT|nr:putative mitochondrial protein [Nicotiana attenuata]